MIIDKMPKEIADIMRENNLKTQEDFVGYIETLFRQTLLEAQIERANKIVSKWPEWEQNLLGKVKND